MTHKIAQMLINSRRSVRQRLVGVLYHSRLRLVPWKHISEASDKVVRLTHPDCFPPAYILRSTRFWSPIATLPSWLPPIYHSILPTSTRSSTRHNVGLRLRLVQLPTLCECIAKQEWVSATIYVVCTLLRCRSSALHLRMVLYLATAGSGLCMRSA